MTDTDTGAGRRSRLLGRLGEGTLLGDGAIGTYLYTLGVTYDKSFDGLCLTAPDLVRRVHNDYVAAGAELIETNTFGANAFRLAEHGLADQVADINRRGAELARQVADRTAREVFVGGSVGPLGVTIGPVGTVATERAAAAFREQIEALAAGGADLIVIETMTHLDEALTALTAARAVTDLPVLVSMTFGEEGTTADGATPEHAARSLTSAGADVVGANCSTGPAHMLGVATRLVGSTHLPVAAMPNAGLPTVVGARYVYSAPPGYMAGLARDMAGAGVGLLGGCCGTTPEYVAAMRKALAEEDGLGPRLSFPTLDHLGAEAAGVTPGPTHLQSALRRRFVVTVEVDPPNGFDAGALLPRLRELRDSGLVDAIDVADSPRAQARMSALALAALIQGRLGMETVLHMGCRHRNLVAMHSDLLGGHALGIRNVFVVMGDLPAMGDYPDATVVNDVTATGLMRLLSAFNAGLDLAGRPMAPATAYHIGCALNFNARDPNRELRLLDKKVEAGAQFALTQPVYDVTSVERFRRAYGADLPIPTLIGVLPLWNARHAAFLQNEVPGIEVPEEVMSRMVKAGENGRDTGIRLATELLSGVGDRVQGAYFMPPFGRYDLVLAVMAGVSGVTEPVPA